MSDEPNTPGTPGQTTGRRPPGAPLTSPLTSPLVSSGDEALGFSDATVTRAVAGQAQMASGRGSERALSATPGPGAVPRPPVRQPPAGLWSGLRSLSQHLAAAGGRLSPAQRHLAMLLVVLGSLLLLLLPLPGVILDGLLLSAWLLSLSMLVAAVRAGEPLHLPQLPSLLLLSVLLRLGLNLAGLRAILSAQATPSFLIREGGALFFGDDVWVGALVMLGFALVEYLVLARGGERVAEVAARFVLDALPGRQAAIEADLRSGAITQQQAQERRALLDREAQIYGALDGSFRLLRGDVVAALLLLSAGVIFALLLGVLRQGLDPGEAAERSVRWVLSQALWTQIPVLLNVAAAGLLLTRAGLQPAAAADSASGSAGSAGIWLDLGTAVPLDAAGAEAVRSQLAARLGFAVPDIALRHTAATASAPRTVHVWLHGARLASFSAASPGEAQGQLVAVLLAAAPDLLTLDGVQGLLSTLQPQAPALLRETLPRRIELGRLTAVLRRLLSQRIWPIDLRAVLEVIAVLPKPDPDLAALVEQIRGQLGRFLLQGFLQPGLSDAAASPLPGGGAHGDGLPALLISTEIESMLRDSRIPDGGRLEPDLVRDIVQGAVSAKQMAPEAVLLCHSDVRRALEDLLLGTPAVLPIVAYSEVPASIRVIVMGRVEPGGENATPVVDSSAVPWQMRTRL